MTTTIVKLCVFSLVELSFLIFLSFSFAVAFHTLALPSTHKNIIRFLVRRDNKRTDHQHSMAVFCFLGENRFLQYFRSLDVCSLFLLVSNFYVLFSKEFSFYSSTSVSPLVSNFRPPFP